MALADIDLLCAAQSADATNEIRDEFAERFVRFLRHCAGRGCCLYKLDLSMIEDVVNLAILMVLDGRRARFKPSRGETHLAYLSGMVQNAAKQQARFAHRGTNLRQDWGASTVAQRHLPTCLEEISDAETASLVEVEEVVAQVLAVADADERLLIRRHYFEHESLESIASSMGVARTTVSRRLDRFYHRAAAPIAA